MQDHSFSNLNPQEYVSNQLDVGPLSCDNLGPSSRVGPGLIYSNRWAPEGAIERGDDNLGPWKGLLSCILAFAHRLPKSSGTHEQNSGSNGGLQTCSEVQSRCIPVAWQAFHSSFCKNAVACPPSPSSSTCCAAAQVNPVVEPHASKLNSCNRRLRTTCVVRADVRCVGMQLPR